MSEDESVGDIERDLEVILEGDQDCAEEHVEEADNAANSENQGNVDGTKKEVKAKRVVRNPQPKLNEQTLKGPRGLTAVENYFERVKFKGRGYEEQDLNTLLKTYEYWCHRLFPKFPFDDCITRLEKLGTKRATQVQIKKIRMGLNFDEAENPILNDEENDTGGFIDSYNDQFDELASTEPINESEPDISEEQLEKIKQNMEKAKRLREEKLRKMRENTQNNGEVYNQMDTQDSECTESANILNDSQKNCNIKQSNEILTEDLLESEHQVDDEEDIDNILSYINEDNINEHTENINKKVTDLNIDKSNDSNKANNKVIDENSSITEISNDHIFHEINLLNQPENVSATEATTNS